MAAAETRDEALMRILLGNVSAARFVSMMVQILHLWDDLIDRDKNPSDETINRIFCMMLLDLPRNEFYVANFDHLNPILVNSIVNWMVATKMERNGSEYEKRIAYILRSSYIDLTTQCAVLVGGVEHGARVGYENRMYAHQEGWEGYLANLDTETERRTFDAKE